MTQRLCHASEVTESGREFLIHGENGPFYLMVFRRGEHLLAYHNICPHKALNLNCAPDKFLIGDDGLLVCAHHGAVFNLDSGECLQGPCKGASLRAVPVSIRTGELWME